MTKSKLNKHPLCHSIAGAVLTLSGLVGAADPRYGHLPPGSISISETREVNAEICRDHLFDPSAASSRLPAGYRLINAEEAAHAMAKKEAEHKKKCSYTKAYRTIASTIFLRKNNTR